MSSEYKVLLLDESSHNLKKQLMPFIHSLDNVPLFAYPEWDDIIRQQTGSPVFRIVVKRDDAVVATAAFTLILSSVFKDRIVSSGFFTGTNLLYTDEKALELLLKKAEEIAIHHDVAFIEFKNQDLSKYDNIELNDSLYNGFTRRLEDTPEEIMAAISRKKRADIRKAVLNKRLEFSTEVSFDDFYHIYSYSQRNLGTPIHSKSFYKAIYYLKAARLCGVLCDNKTIAICMYFEDGETCTAYYGGALEQARQTHAYDLMYYKLMCLAAENGRTLFDFGRSKGNTGAFNYKKFWGFDPQPIPYSYLRVQDAELPDNTPLNPKFRKPIQIWRMLPLWFANMVGPFIVRKLG